MYIIMYIYIIYIYRYIYMHYIYILYIFIYIYMCVCVCVCVCVCMYVYVCINVANSKQCYNCHMHNTISRIYLPNVTKFQKFVSWKLKKFVTYTCRTFLPVWTFVTSPRRLKYIYIKIVSWKRILIGIFF